jgi:hypothetical protein
MIVRYQNIRITKEDPKAPEYFVNNIYPDIPSTEDDDYIITVLGDRLDLLASDFYGDVTMWWIIASANSLPGDSLYIEPGTQLRIPSNPMEILNNYKSFNVTR